MNTYASAMDPVSIKDLDNGSIVLNETMVDFLTQHAQEAETNPQQFVHIAPLISFEGFDASSVFEKAARWTAEHVDDSDAAIVSTRFEHHGDRPLHEPRYELILVILAM